MLRVRRDHTCISLELFRNNEKDLCDKCYAFRQRQKGIGRRPGKNAVPKCEKPWFLLNIDKQPSRLIAKKEKCIKLLKEYGFKVTDENCERKQESRLCSKKNYRDNWSSKVNNLETKTTQKKTIDENIFDNIETKKSNVNLHALERSKLLDLITDFTKKMKRSMT